MFIVLLPDISTPWAQGLPIQASLESTGHIHLPYSSPVILANPFGSRDVAPGRNS
jgi:hypothetical protein